MEAVTSRLASPTSLPHSILTQIMEGVRGAVGQDKTPMAWMVGALTLLITSYQLSPGRKLVQILPPPRMRRIFVAPSPCHVITVTSPTTATATATPTTVAAKEAKPSTNNETTLRTATCTSSPSGWRKFVILFRIAFPSWHSRECYTLLLQTVLMLVRAFLSMRMARVSGQMAQASIARRMPALLRLLGRFALYFIPASVCDSSLDYLGQMQQLRFRENLTRYFHRRYLRQGVFYSVAGMQSMTMIDQRLTEDISRWAAVSSRVLTSISRPLMEAVQFSALMYRLTGLAGPALTWSYYMGFCLFAFVWAPNIDWMAAQRMSNEGAYQDAHQAALAYAEEITVMHGQPHEAAVLTRLLEAIANQTRYAAFVHARFNLVEMLYNKYGSVLVCYVVMAMALLRDTQQLTQPSRASASASASATAALGKASASVEEQLMRYAELSFIYKVLAQAIGRLLWNIKLVLAINGYTQRLYQFVEALECAEGERGDVRGGSGRHHRRCAVATAWAPSQRLQQHRQPQQERPHAGVLARLDSVRKMNKRKEQLLRHTSAPTTVVSATWGPLGALAADANTARTNTALHEGAAHLVHAANACAPNDSNSQGDRAAVCATLASASNVCTDGADALITSRVCADVADGYSDVDACEASATVMSPLLMSRSCSTPVRMMDGTVVAAAATNATATLSVHSSTAASRHRDANHTNHNDGSIHLHHNNNHTNISSHSNDDDDNDDNNNSNDSIHGIHTNCQRQHEACQDCEEHLSCAPPPTPPSSSSSCGTIVRDDHIEFIHVPLILPTGETLCPSLSFYVKPGMNLLIVGPNGCGKTSTFRLLGELWPLRGGTMVKPERSQMYYLPQRPYMYDGTLFEQIIYPTPRSHATASESELYECLRMAGLEYIFERPQVSWNAHMSWADDNFSIGEKQRLAMARLFFHRPRFAILDECSSTLDHAMESQFYAHCRDMGITTITIAHRRSVWRMHNWILYFDGQGGYMFAPLQFTSRSARAATGVYTDIGQDVHAHTSASQTPASSMSLVLAGVVSASDTSVIGKVVPIQVAGGDNEDDITDMDVRDEERC